MAKKSDKKSAPKSRITKKSIAKKAPAREPKTSAKKAPAKKAPAKKAAPAPASFPVSKLKRKKIYSIKDLAEHKRADLVGNFSEIEKHADELEALKKPGDMWIAKIQDKDGRWHSSLKPYSHIDLLIRDLRKYDVFKEYGSKKSTRILKSIQIMKFSGSGRSQAWTARDYKRVRAQETAARLARNEEKKEKQKQANKRAREAETKVRHQAEQLKRQAAELRKLKADRKRR